MKGYNRLISLILLVFSGPLLSVADKLAETPFETLVHTQNGPIQGIINISRNSSIQFVSFVGLRYANRPARFEPAQVLDSTWTTPKLANIPGSSCPQVGEEGTWIENEDCLFLNVHVPKSALEQTHKKLPIMVWLHGGGYSFGAGHEYGADYMMESEDVILVTLNYRLGLLGFLTMETDDTFTSNNGLRDVVTALKWIQKNIQAFSGDKDRVTIAGNSAGSAIAHYLLMSPLATGLFHGGIMQSGAFSFWSYSPNPRKDALQLATLLNCGDSEIPKDVRKCLEEKSVKDLLIGQATFSPRWPTGNFVSRFTPTGIEFKENAFFLDEPTSFFTFHGGATNYVNKVPVMAGYLRDEGSTIYTAFVLSEENQLKQLDENWDRLAGKTFAYDSYVSVGKLQWISKRLRDYYFGKAPVRDSVEFLTAMYSDSYFVLPVMHAVGDMANAGIPVWPYVFTYLSDWSIRDALGLATMSGMVGHADELQYLFPHPLLGPPLKPNSDTEKFSKNLVKFWTSFVKNGEPAAGWFDGEPLNWKPITKLENTNKDSEEAYSKFDMLRINSDPKIIKTFEFNDRIKFWRKNLKKAVEIKRNNDRKHIEL